MARMTVASLDKHRQDMKAKYPTSLQPSQRTRIIVGMGTCGIASGARNTMAALMKTAGEKNLDIEIGQSGCIGICDREPIVTVIRKGEPQVRYGKVTAEIMNEIIRSHVIGGRVVEKYMLADAPKA